MKKIKEVIAYKKKHHFFYKNLNEFFSYYLRQNFEYISDCIITITDVSVLDSGNLVKVYFTSFSTKFNKTEKNILHFFNKKKKAIRYLFGKMFAKKLKRIPKFDFYIDDVQKILQQSAKIEN